MARPPLYCLVCHTLHTATEKHFPGVMTKKEQVKIPDTKPQQYKIIDVVIGYVCAKCCRKNEVERIKPEIRKHFKMDEKEVITKSRIREYVEILRSKFKNIKPNRGGRNG